VATGTFTSSASLATARGEHTATHLPDGSTLIAGGFAATNMTFASTELFTASSMVALGAHMLTARSQHTATLLSDDTVLVAGGSDDRGLPVSAAELLSAGGFVAAGNLAHGRASATATLLPSGDVLIAGGFDSTTQTALSSAEVYHAGTPSPPTVSISVSPTTIFAGGVATLTWSSTNASSCTASGSWSGAQPTTGMLNVAPVTPPGDYTYTLTCKNSAASASASAVLTLNPPRCIPTTCAAQHATCGTISDNCFGMLDCGPCTFTDDFTGSGLGPSWIVADGAFSVSGGAALGTAHDSYAVWSGTPDADVTVGITLGAPTGSTFAGVIARASTSSPASDHYAAYVGPDGTLAVARRDNWDYTELATGPKVSGGGHTIQLTVTGSGPTTLTVTLDGVTVITVVDSSKPSLADGLAGIFDFDGASRQLRHFTVESSGAPICQPTTCTAQHTTCGSIPDGCGNALACGTCTTGTCGGGGVPNQCGSASAMFTDDFTGTSLGSSWTVARGAFSEHGGAAFATAKRSYAVWTGSPGATSTVAVTLGPPTSSTYAGVIARASAAAADRDHYAAYLGPDGSVMLARRNDYVYSYLGTGPKAQTGAHTIVLVVSGQSPVKLTVLLDGVAVINATDSSSQAHTAAGRAGIFDYNGVSRPFHHFTVGP
jgi:hypothetical protein